MPHLTVPGSFPADPIELRSERRKKRPFWAHAAIQSMALAAPADQAASWPRTKELKAIEAREIDAEVADAFSFCVWRARNPTPKRNSPLHLG